MKELLSTMDNYNIKISHEDIEGRFCSPEPNLNSKSYILIENNIHFNESTVNGQMILLLKIMDYILFF